MIWQCSGEAEAETETILKAELGNGMTTTAIMARLPRHFGRFSFFSFFLSLVDLRCYRLTVSYLNGWGVGEWNRRGRAGRLRVLGLAAWCLGIEAWLHCCTVGFGLRRIIHRA